MTNPFGKTPASRLSYAGIWMMIIVVQILLFGFYFGRSDRTLWQYVGYDSLVCNSLYALCLLGLWYPVQYYRSLASVSLFIVFHLLLFILSSAIGWGVGYLIMRASWEGSPQYSEFFLHLLPVRILFGLFVYILFALVYYLFLTNSILREQRKAIEENGGAGIDVSPASIEKLSRISVKKRQEIRFIPVSQIHCIEASGDYVMIYTANDKFLKDKTMKYWETHLPEDVFVRIHRSFIVNMECIAKLELYEKETYKVLLKSGNSLKISASGYKLLKQKMQL
ncbi:MAG: LytTR family transcriptional regulator [Dysgonamonadaceae bacterium]|nr:LytTR family transcriptional regulator [Dysgonamonadaceae bacterium]